MQDVLLLAPVLLPLLGAGALLLLDEEYWVRGRDPLPALIAGTVFAAFLLLIENIPVRFELFSWFPARYFDIQPTILIDSFALPFVFGLLLVALAATIVGDYLSGQSWAMALLLWGGSLSMVISANATMLLVSWVMCEAALVGASLLVRDSRTLIYRLAVGGAGLAALMLLILQYEAQAGIALDIFLTSLTPRWVLLILVLGAIRMAVFPFHVVGLRQTDVPTAPLVLGRLSGAIAGLYIWMRCLEALGRMPAWFDFVILYGGLVALISALAAWTARSDQALLTHVIGFELGLILVLLGFETPQHRMLAVLEMVNLIVAGGVLGLGLHLLNRVKGRWERGWCRGLVFLALASLLGLPPTPGFVARWGLYRYALEDRHWWVLFVVALASGLLLPALLGWIRNRPAFRPRSYPVHAIAGMTILGLPLVLISAQPLFLAPVVDLLTGMGAYPMMAHLIRGTLARHSIWLILLIILPALVGYSLEHLYDQWRTHRQTDVLEELLSLEWLYELLAASVLRAAIAVAVLLAFFELGSTLGFAIVMLLLLALWALRR